MVRTILIQRNKYARDQMKLTGWKRKDTKDNQYNSTCKHNNLDKVRKGKLNWNLSVTMDVIEYLSNNWDINIWKLYTFINLIYLLHLHVLTLTEEHLFLKSSIL